jgi:predicted HicB family RNase H-like nuclease
MIPAVLFKWVMTKLQGSEPTKAFNLRMPKSLHKSLSDLAIAERRSLNDQIIYLLERSVVRRS